MTKKWKIAEKIIGSIQILFGSLSIFFFVKNIREMIYLGGYSTIRAIELHFPKGHNGILLGIFSLTSGILITLNKRVGWVGSITTWLTLIILIIIFSITDTDFELTEIIYLIIIILVIISFPFLLTRKPFLNKYKPDWSEYILILIMTCAFIIDMLVYRN